MKEEKPIVVNMADGQHTLTILQGEAPRKLDEKEPLKTEIVGTITAPLDYLGKRVNDIDQHKAYILVSRDDMEICLILNENDPRTYGRVTGVMVLSKIFSELGINNPNKGWVPEQLGQFLKLNRSIFVNKEENMAVVNSLKSFTAKVNQDVQRESNEKGNRAMVFRQAVDSNIPEKFKLYLPIFRGDGYYEIEVETYACVNGTDVTIQLQSAGANDVTEDVKHNKIDYVLDAIREIAPEIVIIEV